MIKPVHKYETKGGISNAVLELGTNIYEEIN